MTWIMRFCLAGFVCLAIYLFVSAPPPLADGAGAPPQACTHPVEQMFATVNALNQAARDVYTKDIVGAGLKAGLAFGEDWQEPGVEKGPLPALFLRLTAAKLEARPVRLGLFLGSDAPINASNLFEGVQAAQFSQVKSDRNPVFSQQTGYGQIAMYPDIAAVAPCVTCHNDHADSPKTDWQLGDVMGATTWIYPEDFLTSEDYFDALSSTYAAIGDAYSDYLKRAETFDPPVTIGPNWPVDAARNLPDVTVFLARVRQAAGALALNGILTPTATIEGEPRCAG